MADFTALKNSIRNYIKQNGNAEITGEVLQNILISMVVSMGDGAINGIADGLANEGNARTNADGLLQNAINSISAALGDGYTYAGIATPATTPASGRVFYLALQAGTYTNFGGQVVTQGINILKNNNGTWQLDNIIGIDDVPTKGSVKLVTSGGVFANIGAFDISDYNKSGSTLATYANLTAALAALPSEYQKGGMSVKFVQSSDNKYVQYRLMSDSFNTTVANWQGVDAVPILGSANYVTSDGIYKDSIPNQTFFRKSTEFEVKVGNVTQTGTTRDSYLNTLGRLIKSIESINFEGNLLGLRFMEVKNDNIEMMFNLYESENSAYVKQSYVSVSLSSVIANGNKIYNGFDYTNKAFCIEFYDDAITYIQSLASAIRIDGRSVSDATYAGIGIYNVKDITNPVFNLNPLNFSLYNNVTTLWSANACIIKVLFGEGKIGYIRYIEKVGSNLVVAFATCNYNANEEINSSDSSYRIITRSASYNDNSAFISLPFPEFGEGSHIIIDVRKILDGVNTMSFPYTLPVTASFIGELYEEDEIIYPTALYDYFVGYYNDIPNRVVESGYTSIIVPINIGCEMCQINDVLLDKNANIAVLDRNGFLLKWAWVNVSDGKKYSGNDTITNVVINSIQDAKYILISSAISLSNCSIRIKGYNAHKVVLSINDVRCQPSGNYGIGSYRLSKVGDKIMCGSEHSYKKLPTMQLQENTESITFNGRTYTYNCLCDIDVEGTKYYIGFEGSGTSNMYLMWKKASDGTSSVLFYGDNSDSWKLKNGNGEEISLPSAYDGYGWFMSFWQGQYATCGIKCLPDGELIIWLLANKIADDNYKLTVCFKTSDSQTNLVPKFVFSNEHYTKDNRTYSVNGYIAPNNGIDVLEYDNRTLVAITEYGTGEPSYWDAQGIQKNANGIVGKVWVSIDGGTNFKKIFDFDQKINGDASDESDDNWTWADNKLYRMNAHMHGIKFDEYARKLFWTNGDGVDNLFYTDLYDLIAWMVNYGETTNASDVNAKYVDNEVLCDTVYRYRIDNAYSPLCSNGSRIGGNSYNIQIWSMIAITDALLLGHDTARQTITGVQHSDMPIARNTEMDIHIDLFALLDEDSPSGPIDGLVENFIQKDADSPVLAYHARRGFFASYNGIDWKQVYVQTNENVVTSFMGTFVLNPKTNEVYAIKRESSSKAGVGVYKILNY